MCSQMFAKLMQMIIHVCSLIDPLERYTSSFSNSYERELEIIPEEGSSGKGSSARQTPVNDIDFEHGHDKDHADGNSGGRGKKELVHGDAEGEGGGVLGDLLASLRQIGHFERQDKDEQDTAKETETRNPSEVKRARDSSTRDGDLLSALRQIGRFEGQDKDDQGTAKESETRNPSEAESEDVASLLLPIALPQEEGKQPYDSNRQLHFKFRAPFVFKGDQSSKAAGDVHNGYLQVPRSESQEALDNLALAKDLQKSDHIESSIEYNEKGDQSSKTGRDTCNIYPQVSRSESESQEALDYFALANDLQKSDHLESSIEYYDKGLTTAKGHLLRSALMFNRSVACGRLGVWDQVSTCDAKLHAHTAYPYMPCKLF